MLLLISVFTCLCLNIHRKLYLQIETLFLRIDRLGFLCISFMSLGMLLSLSKTYISVYTHTHIFCCCFCTVLSRAWLFATPWSVAHQAPQLPNMWNPPIPCFWQPPMTMIGPQMILDTGFPHSYFWTFAIINIVRAYRRQSSQGISKVGYTNNSFLPLYLLMLMWFLKCSHSLVQCLIWCSGVSPN